MDEAVVEVAAHFEFLNATRRRRLVEECRYLADPACYECSYSMEEEHYVFDQRSRHWVPGSSILASFVLSRPCRREAAAGGAHRPPVSLRLRSGSGAKDSHAALGAVSRTRVRFVETTEEQARMLSEFGPEKRGHFVRQGHYFGYADGVFVDIYFLTPVAGLDVMAPTEAAGDPAALRYWFMKVGMFAADGDGDEARQAGNARVALLHVAHVEAEARVNCATALLRAAMPKVVVVGAPDAIALAALRALAARARGSLRLVAALHAPGADAVAALRDMAGVDLAHVSLDDASSLHPALRAADAVLVVPPRHEGGGDQAERAIEAAEQGGAGFLALISVLTAGQGRTPFSAQFRRVEERASSASTPHAVLRCAPLHDVFALGAESVRQGYLSVPGDGTAITSTVDASDVGAAAATVLYSPHAHADKEHRLVGPTYTFSDAAVALGRVAGGGLTSVRLSPDQFADRMASGGVSAHETGGVTEQLTFISDGRAPLQEDDIHALPRLIARSPVPFEQWAKDHAALFQDEAE